MISSKSNFIVYTNYAGMVELADTQDLGSCAHKRAGSTPVTRTKQLPVMCFKHNRELFNLFKVFFIKFDKSEAYKTYNSDNRRNSVVKYILQRI